MLSAEQLAQLRDSLPPFADAQPPSPRLEAFCRDYGIDFAARRPQLQYRGGAVRSAGYQLAVHQWCQPGATSNLLILHGYLDHSGLFGHLIEYGLSRHSNVLIFDLPGHGLSSGDPVAIDDFAEYSQAIADVLAAAPSADTSPAPLPLWVMAQSTGSAALVEFARNRPWPFSAAILLAPLVRPAGWRRVQLAHRLLHRFADSVHREFTRNSSDQDFLAFLRRDPLQSRRISVRWVGALRRWLADLPIRDLGVGPALVLQGDVDGTVDWRYNMRAIATLFPGSHLEVLPGAGHQLANESLAIRRQYLTVVDDWLADHLPEQPAE